MSSKTGPYLIVGLVGRAGAGKDTTAAVLAHAAGYERVAFADAVRIEIAHSFGVDSRLFTSQHLKEQAVISLAIGRSHDHRFIRQMCELDKDISVMRSPRQIMRWWATEYRRNLDGEQYWINRLHDRIEDLHSRGHRRIAISDVRFLNEAAFVKEINGQLWRVSRQFADRVRAPHQSEWEVDDITCDRTIDNNGTRSSLVREAIDAHMTCAPGDFIDTRQVEEA